MTAGIFGTVLVALAVLVIVLVSVTGQKSTGKQGFGTKAVPVLVVSAITQASSSAFAEAGSTITSSGPYLGGISALKKQPPLTSAGKPLVTYMGLQLLPLLRS